jgi:hypothetical protein
MNRASGRILPKVKHCYRNLWGIRFSVGGYTLYQYGDIAKLSTAFDDGLALTGEETYYIIAMDKGILIHRFGSE